MHRGLGEEGWTAEHELMLPPDLQLNQDDDA
jgi:hypothetical protein